MELSIQSISKSYKNKQILDNISLTFTSGVYSFLGANGSGKTTLMRIIINVLKPTSGKVLLNGEEITGLGEEYRDLLGYVPQHVAFYPNMKVHSFLEYVGTLKGIEKKVLHQKVDYWLKQVNLYEERNQKIRKLSGGMKQRVGIAQAMLNDPKILILDEPTAGLDPKERIRFRSIIASLSVNRIVLYTTHIASDLEGLTDYVCILRKGKLEQLNRPEEVLNTLKNKVWEVIIRPSELANIENTYRVGAIEKTGGQIRVRLYHEDQPLPAAIKKEPTLEDIYLYYFREEQ
ncbi:ABC transporter ATP-binding protein [Psychrobacillus sp. OK032]|uniref:ABC transporter ATP-binding protein n=1 Tax=Psychrobacillus sp. OK032 TaxID=1884358 RepID=UPI0008C6B4B1|nr:ABC transporter ATP-binding protein [Psychrobacillus sp. OK032]SES45380.1 ABC-type multidrug transport system, ATPase component [Psychrobacillus sp. OK032]